MTSLCRALLADDVDQALFRKPMLSAVAPRKQAAPRPIGRLCSNICGVRGRDRRVPRSSPGSAARISMPIVPEAHSRAVRRSLLSPANLVQAPRRAGAGPAPVDEAAAIACCRRLLGFERKDPGLRPGSLVVLRSPSRLTFELQSTPRIKRVRICHREHKQVELLNDEPERYHGDAGAHPSEKRSLVSSMITVAADHENTSSVVRNTRR